MSDRTTTITLSPDRPGGVIAPELYGWHLEHIWNCVYHLSAPETVERDHDPGTIHNSEFPAETIQEIIRPLDRYDRY